MQTTVSPGAITPSSRSRFAPATLAAQLVQVVVEVDLHRVALGLTAAASILAAGLTAVSTTLAHWIPVTFGVVGGLLIFGLIVDALRRR